MHVFITDVRSRRQATMMDIVDEGEWERPARPWPEGGETSEGPPGECRDIGGIKKAGLWAAFLLIILLIFKVFMYEACL